MLIMLVLFLRELLPRIATRKIKRPRTRAAMTRIKTRNKVEFFSIVHLLSIHLLSIHLYCNLSVNESYSSPYHSSHLIIVILAVIITHPLIHSTLHCRLNIFNCLPHRIDGAEEPKKATRASTRASPSKVSPFDEYTPSRLIYITHPLDLFS